MSAFLGRILDVKERISSSRQAGFMTHQVCDLSDIPKATLYCWERKGVIAESPRDLEKLEALYEEE